MKILVVTATRGGGQWFQDTLETIALLKNQRIPVVWAVVGPASAIDVYSKLPEVDYGFVEQGAGLYVALNQAIRQLSELNWTHFSYINDDDGFRPGFIQLVKEAESGEFDVYYGDIDFVDSFGRRIGAVSIARRVTDCLPLFSRGIAPFSQQGMLMTREVLEGVGLFDVKFSHVADAFLWVRCFEIGARFKYVAAVCAFYRIRPGQLSNAVDLMYNQNLLVTEHVLKFIKITKLGFYCSLLRFRLSNLRGVFGRFFRVGFRSSRSMFKRGVEFR